MSRNPTTLTVAAPAKLNLFLEVTGRRADGYHEVETVMAPIDLCDSIELTPLAETEIRLDCHPVVGHPWWKDPASIPVSAENLIVRALRKLQTAKGIQQGMAVRLVKRIPVAAGLGGGSSDAAAVLWGANCVWQAGCSLAELQGMAAELGSDIPFFLQPAPAICTGRGECIERRLRLPAMTWIVIAPRQGNLTREVYDRCQVPSRPSTLPGCLRHDRVLTKREVQELLFNRLEEPAAGLNPSIGRCRAEFQRSGLRHHQLTGSGAAYFGLCEHRRHAEWHAGRFRQLSLGSVFIVQNAHQLRPE